MCIHLHHSRRLLNSRPKRGFWRIQNIDSCPLTEKVNHYKASISGLGRQSTRKESIVPIMVSANTPIAFPSFFCMRRCYIRWQASFQFPLRVNHASKMSLPCFILHSSSNFLNPALLETSNSFVRNVLEYC